MMKRAHPLLVLALACGFYLSCSSSSQPDEDAESPAPTEDAGQTPPNQDTPDAEAPEEDTSTSQPTTQPMTVVRPDASQGSIEPARVSTYTLKERYRIGLSIRREVQVQRRYRLRIESDFLYFSSQSL